MSGENTRPEPREGQNYVRVSELAKFLGWGRTKPYYWLKRCPDIEVIRIAGLSMVRVEEVPKILMRLRQVHDEAMAKRYNG